MAAEIATLYYVVTQPQDGSDVLFTCPDGYIARLRSVAGSFNYQTVGQDGDTNQGVSFIGPAIGFRSPGPGFFNVASGLQTASLGLWNFTTAAGLFEASESWLLGQGAVTMSQSPFGEVQAIAITSPLPDVWILPSWTIKVFGDATSEIAGLIELLEAATTSPVQAGDAGAGSNLPAAKVPFLIPLG